MNKYISTENNLRKNKILRILFADHKASSFTPTFGKFLWRIWKIKSPASSLYLRPLNQLPHVTTMEATKMNHKSSHRRCFVKNALLETLQNSLWNTCTRVSFLKNFTKKETLAQVFYSEFCKIFKNTIFTKHIWATASGTRNPT